MFGWDRRFILASGKRHPSALGEVGVKDFQTRLAEQAHWLNPDLEESGELRDATVKFGPACLPAPQAATRRMRSSVFPSAFLASSRS